MVKILFYGEEQIVDQIPENYYDFIQIIGVLFSIETVHKLTIEYTTDNKTFTLLTEQNFRSFFLSGTKDTIVMMYFTKEESNYYNNSNKEDKKIEEKLEEKLEEKIEEKEEEDEEEDINTDKKESKENEIKVPEITKDMVIASIVKQVKENMEKSRIMLKEKQKKEEEERIKKEKEEKERIEKEKQQTKEVSDQINNLITNRLDNLKEELINESQIKLSEIVSESQLNLKNLFENNNINDENEEKIHSLEEHPGIKCTKCGMSPIVGNRYCCVYCQDINYCENCEENNGLIHGHPLYKLKLRIE